MSLVRTTKRLRFRSILRAILGRNIGNITGSLKQLGAVEQESDGAVVDAGHRHVFSEDALLVCHHPSLHINLKLTQNMLVPTGMLLHPN